MDDYARGVNLFISTAPGHAAGGVPPADVQAAALERRGLISIGMMMVDMLDTHWDVKLAREKIAAKLNNPQLEADLYPVGSWRDRPPTGEVIDLAQAAARAAAGKRG